MSIFINNYSLISALGNGLDETRRNLFSGISPGMVITDKYSPGKELYLGMVGIDLPTLNNAPLKYRSRNNQLLLATFEQLRYSFYSLFSGVDRSRIAVIIGSSTSGISEEEAVFPLMMKEGFYPGSFDISQRLYFSPASFLAGQLGISGPAYGISTACTSSSKAIVSGARLLMSGMVDLVIAGGVDSLCKFTIAGFNSIEAISSNRCNPFSVNRSVINIGEGCALFLMSRDEGDIQLTGWGESSDGHHISAPDPNGSGPSLAITEALRMANKTVKQVEYINLHGTSTYLNDQMEAALIHGLAFDGPMSSTKPLTGHTLGAAGAIEAAVCCLTLSDNGRLPPHVWDECQDPKLPKLNFTSTLSESPKVVMTNNFAFGGNNTSLIMESV